MATGWILDADGIDFDSSISKNVYQNRIVKIYLDEEKKLGIAATRGLGKTYLLKVKRTQCQSKPGTVCLPNNSMVDAPSATKFHESTENYFKDYESWLHLWRISISLSILKMSISDKLNSVNIVDNYSDEVKSLFNMHFTTVCEYFNFILTCDRKFINKLTFDSANLMNHLKSIHSSVYAFIDKVDQALSNQTQRIVGQSSMSTGPRNASFWQFAQLSLAEVAYEILTINPHIKIYYTIRKEALVDASQISYTYQNFAEYICTLEYNKNDLMKMYEQYISNEHDDNLLYPELKHDNPSKAFIGVDCFKSRYTSGNCESTFEYILRHTFSRPRDIMDVCYKLFVSDLKNSKSIEDDIRHTVNIESQILLETYISEIEPFIFNLDRDLLQKLCELISLNVIDKRYARYICRRLNDEYSNGCEMTNHVDCAICEKIHPFCQLFNAGLLANLWKSRNGEYSIRFNNINESSIEARNHLLPDSEIYFLHPCFASKVEHIRKNSNRNFSFSGSILVGNYFIVPKQKVSSTKKMIVKRYTEVREERIFLSSTCYDLTNERNEIEKILSNLGFDVVRSDNDNFSMELNGVNSHDHCIDEMLKCKSVLFIVGKRYGGEYSGNKYIEFANEIANINRNLEKPSISLVEYFVAKKNNLNIKTFIRADICNERLSFKNNLNFEPAFVDDNRVFHIIDFITRQAENNWFNKYNDLKHLEGLVNIVYGM